MYVCVQCFIGVRVNVLLLDPQIAGPNPSGAVRAMSYSEENNLIHIILLVYCWYTVELAPIGFDVKSFPRRSRFRGGGIATVYKSTFCTNIKFKTNFDFTHTSFEVV